MQDFLKPIRASFANRFSPRKSLLVDSGRENAVCLPLRGTKRTDAAQFEWRYWVDEMHKRLGTIAMGLLGATALATGAFAQEALNENPLAQDSGFEDEQSAPEPTVEADARFDEAFPVMVSEPLVQGDIAPPGPVEGTWSEAQVEELIAYIGGIEAEGLNQEDYEADALAEALAANGPGDAVNAQATKVFRWLVEDLRDGRTPMSERVQWFVVDPDRDRFRTRALVEEVMAGAGVAETLNKLHPAHPDYAALRAELEVTPIEEAGKRKLIRANMDRWRWLARDLGKQYLLTNVPEFQLRLTVADKIISTYRTVVGKPGRTATPQLAEVVSGVVFNPTWTVPQSIVKGEGLGERVLSNPQWARSKGYVATRGANGYISVVQRPGPTNSLGRMKLEMPNRHAIFFHDTPSRGLFNNDNRALSHGCIRTERALELAITMAILGKGATKEEAVRIATSGEYTKVMVEKKMPAYITYFTMGVDIDGNLREFKDIYGRDKPVLASLGGPRVQNRSGVSDDEVIVIENNPLAS
jgi:L,D-transpeptidase YcbB